MPGQKTGKLKLTRRADSKFWWITGTLDGRRIRQSTGTASKVWAEEQRIALEARYQHARIYGPGATTTFGDAALMYIQAGKCIRFLEPLIRYFGETLIGDINGARAMEAAANIYPGAKPATINRQCIGKISAVVNFARRAEGLATITLPKLKEPKGKTRWLSPAEADRLILAASGHHCLAQFITFLLGTGARLSRAANAQSRHFHLASNEARLLDTKTADGRIVWMPARSVAALSTLDFADPDASPFKKAGGEAYAVQGGANNFLRQPFHRARDLAGLGDDVTFHTLRHSWATWFYSVNRDLFLLEKFGGWEKADTAKRYAKLAPASLPAELAAHGWAFNYREFEKNRPVSHVFDTFNAGAS